MWRVPLLVVVVVIVLGALRLHGSSVGVYGEGIGQTEDEVGALSGPLRPIRSDEWGIRTPWVLRQTENGFATNVESSIGEHDARMLADIPTNSWDLILRPHTVSYRLLGAERAFATEWWLFHAVQLLGVYALLVALTRRVTISALGAMMVAIAPSTQWWTGPGTYTTVGYGCLAGALLILANRASTSQRRWGLALAAGWALGAFSVATYVPWQISTAMVVAPVVVGAALPQILASPRRWAEVRRFGTTAGAAVVLGGVLFGAFLIDKTEILSTIASTEYPGGRTAAVGGTVPPVVMLGGALDSYAAEQQLTLVNGWNQSENSTGIAYFVPLLVATFGLLASGALRDRCHRIGLLAASLPVVVILAWMQFPVPAAVGRLLLLNRVPAPRLLPAMALAGVVGLAVLSSTLLDLRHRVPTVIGWGAAAAFTASIMWAAGHYRVGGQPIGTKGPLLIALLLGAGVLLAMTRRAILGFSVLVVFGFWQASLVNPLQIGLGPLIDNELRVAVDQLHDDNDDIPNDGWLLISTDAYVSGIVTASGVQNLSSVSPYPDADAFRVLDPDSEYEEIWNRYGSVSFSLGDPGTEAKFALLGPDRFNIAVDPCDPALAELGAGYIVTQGFELANWCARPVGTVPHGAVTLFIYDIRPPSTA